MLRCEIFADRPAKKIEILPGETDPAKCTGLPRSICLRLSLIPSLRQHSRHGLSPSCDADDDRSLGLVCARINCLLRGEQQAKMTWPSFLGFASSYVAKNRDFTHDPGSE